MVNLRIQCNVAAYSYFTRFLGFAHFDDSYHLFFQESEEEVTDTEQAENWFSLTSAQRICGMSAGILVNIFFPMDLKCIIYLQF